MSINKPNIVIIGASGHAKVIIDIIERTNIYHIVGLIDSFKLAGSKVYDYKVIGKEDELPKLTLAFNFNLGIIAIGDNWIRKTMHDKIMKILPDFDFVNAIHPSALIGKNVTIKKGVAMMAGAIVNSDAKVGAFSIINTKASLGHDSQLKDFASLAPSATIGGNVTIGTCTAISLGANVIQDISIGRHAIIGAGALVNKNIADFKMVYGVPAKVIKTIDKGEKYLYQTNHFAKEATTKQKTFSFEVFVEKSDWDAVLKDIGEYDFYHTYDYHMIAKTKNEIPILIKYTQNKSVIAFPLLIRDIEGTNFKDATSVYGYAGPVAKNISKGFNNENFIKSLKNYLIDVKIVSVFSRLNPYISNQLTILKNLGETVSQGKVVNIDLDLDLETQRANYRDRLKTHVNKSRRLCSVRKATTTQDLKAYMEIYHENMDRVNAKKMYYFKKKYFNKLVNSKDFKTEVLLAIENETGAIIAGSMFIGTNNIVQYHLSGTKNEYLHLTPTKLLIDEMRIMATNKGYKVFNLGGGLGGRNDDSLFDFKASFSKDFKEFNLWRLIVNQEIYDELVAKKGIDATIGYFPLYRSLDHITITS